MCKLQNRRGVLGMHCKINVEKKELQPFSKCKVRKYRIQILPSKIVGGEDLFLQAFKMSRKVHRFLPYFDGRSKTTPSPLYQLMRSPRLQKDIDVESWPYISYMTRIHRVHLIHIPRATIVEINDTRQFSLKT